MGQAAEQGYRVVEGHRLEEPCIGAFNGGNRAWGQFGAGIGGAQSFGAGVDRVDFTLDASFVLLNLLTTSCAAEFSTRPLHPAPSPR
ncbi:hypothetical protein ACIA78_31900 [Streptomyces xanthochromogenes]|uniref:hypothetical protein n=1 Tax=Streptomyces xanthochromogenes TaxID=67384 RepID=UPI0037A4B33D